MNILKDQRQLICAKFKNSLYSYPLSPQGLHHPFACTEQIKTDIIIVIRIMIVTSPFPQSPRQFLQANTHFKRASYGNKGLNDNLLCTCIG